MAAPIDELIKIRNGKLEKLRSLGINPYPSKYSQSATPIAKAVKSPGQKEAVEGRITAWREHGSLVFADLKDASGKIQLWFQKEKLGDKKFELLKLFDIGDFLGTQGTVTKTKAGEITIDVTDFELLTKSLRPLPSEWFGIKDEETRYRQRYLDLLLNDDLKQLLAKKAVFWNSMRAFLTDRGFLEVETPVLETTAGGADANPFVTHHNALDIDLYLRISMGELWQKRLMVAGFEKTFEIGRQFRNEGISREHLQDYTQMEFYWAYANFEDSMKLVEEMYKAVIEKTFGKMEFEINNHKVDFAEDWPRIDYAQTVQKEAGVDVTKMDNGREIDQIWKGIREKITGPVFLTGHPVAVSPLAKRLESRPELVERYQVIIAGSEMGNGYSELNDPIDQKERFTKQQRMRDKGDTEAQMLDNDFVTALEYGMPPVTGFGVSERLFSFLANLPIRETVMFPLLRPTNEKK
ncbi:MAG: lysine--tRNA ligase [Patescibacteria group bacterium]|nr:lysine--tRNA ligase [Patescibacteria group bacterium]MCL5431518.1 lysine--tRNA ligase [Patescibacteria group bacterium]